VLAALLPGGSVTGAPKRRATEILGALEPVPRSVYTGALGYVSSNGRADFNLPIRTAYHDGSRLYLHSGGGIVADSVPEREYEEMLVKVDNIRRLLAGS
jgi:anthranilate/para-aminobenzoate synthase component I